MSLFLSCLLVVFFMFLKAVQIRLYKKFILWLFILSQNENWPKKISLFSTAWEVSMLICVCFGMLSDSFNTKIGMHFVYLLHVQHAYIDQKTFRLEILTHIYIPFLFLSSSKRYMRQRQRWLQTNYACGSCASCFVRLQQYFISSGSLLSKHGVWNKRRKEKKKRNA